MSSLPIFSSAVITRSDFSFGSPNHSAIFCGATCHESPYLSFS